MRRRIRTVLQWATLGIALAICPSVFHVGLAGAAEFPQKSISLIIPFSPGGSSDLTSRAVAPLIGEKLGVTVVPENKIGGSGAIAAEFVSTSNPDGYTLFAMPETAALFEVMGISKRNVDDYIPISIFTMGVVTITVPTNSKYRTASDFLDDAKKNPKQVIIGSSGPATAADVAMIILQKYAGAEFTAIPYAGGGPAVLATLGGTVQANFQMVSEVIEHVRAGKLRILATFTNERVSQLPDVPALGEVLPGMKSVLPWGPWWGLAAPKGTPDAVVAKLREAAIAATKDKRYIERFDTVMLNRVNLVGADLDKFLKQWTSTTAWLLYEGNRAKHSPADFSISRP